MRLFVTLLFALSMLCQVSPTFAQMPYWQWGLQSVNPTTWDRTGATGSAVATGAAGQIYVGGTYGQDAPRAGATRLFGAGAVGPGTGGFVAQATAAGNWTWVTDVVGLDPTGDAGARVTGLAVGAAGEVYATGYAGGATLRVGAQQQPVSHELTLFVARLSSTGTCDWLVVAANPLQRTLLTGPSVAFDPSTGGVVVSGNYQGALQLGNLALPATLAGREGLFVARLGSNGVWQSAVGVTGEGIPTSGSQVTSWTAGRVVVGPRGQVAVVGSQVGSLVFGPTTLSVPAGANGGLFVAQLSPANKWEWAVGASIATPASNSEVVGAAYTPTGSLWVSGLGSEGTRIGPLTLLAPGTTSGWHFAGFAGQLSPTGQWSLVRQLSPSPEGWVQLGSLGLDGAGNAVMFGVLRGFIAPAQTIVNGQVLNVAPGQVLTFATALSSTGEWLYAAPMAQPVVSNGLRPGDAAMDASGNFYLAGGLVGNLQVGSTQLMATDPSSGNSFVAGDVVLARLANAGAPPRAAIAGDSLVCTGGMVTLTATGSAAVTGYTWSTGATTASISVTEPGTYSVQTAFAGGLVSTAQFTVRSLTPALALTGDTLLCPGTSTVLRAISSPDPVAYHWSTGATTATLAVTQPGTYELMTTYGPGCTARATRRVRAATLRIDGPSLLCQGSALLTAVAPGATALHWSTGAATPSLAITQPGTFTVVATFANGCTLTASRTVALPVVLITGDTLLCTSGRVLLTATLPGATAYRWSTGDATPTITATQPGNYQVTVTYGSDCTAMAQQSVRALAALPDFTLGADTTLCDQDSLVLRAPALDPGVGRVAYRWSDGSTGPQLQLRQPGVYTLQVTTACEMRTASRRVAGRDCLLIPNVITPNRDGANDVFAVRGLAPGPWALTVYNRWGKQVYQASDYRNDWGGDAPPGLYYYLLQQVKRGVVYRGWVEAIR
jgi:gliding motility-associated-like protein